MEGGRFHRTVGVLALQFFAALTGLAEVSGVVRDRITDTGIPGAIVSLQASGLRTGTDGSGVFHLAVADAQGRVVVGAAKGYFNSAVYLGEVSTGIVILLEPVPQEDDPSYALMPPLACAMCHPDQYYDWLGSPMANAGFNTWVDDVYSGLGTANGIGGFVYVRDSAFAAKNPASECAACHQPERWINSPFSALADPRRPASPDVAHGVSCEVCHKIADVDVSKINYPGIFPGAVTFTRPQGPDYHPVQYGVLADVDFSHPLYMRAAYQPQLVAEVCGTCHQDANDLQEDHTFAGVISEPTYLEWKASAYADPSSPYYATCVDCHMPPAGRDRACMVLDPPLVRDPQTIRSHRILGTTPEFLENAVELSLRVERVGARLEVQVDAANTLTGHHVPTGVTTRNMILLVEGRRNSDGQELRFWGGPTVHDLGGIGDPKQGYYAGLPGKLFAKVNHNADGAGPTFFTDATGILFDNRIAALATDSSFYSFRTPGGGGGITVRAKLIYRRAFRFLVDAKGWTTDGHGNPLADVQPPHFGHLMEQAEQSLTLLRGDADGDADCDLDDLKHLLGCLAGPTAPLDDPDCDVADDNGDGRVDLRDFGAIQSSFDGGW